MSDPIIMDVLRNALYNLRQGLQGTAKAQLSNVIRLIDEKDKGLWDTVTQKDLESLEK